MWISDKSIKRPVFAAMFILALVVLGIVTYPEIGVDLFPRVDFPMVSVSTRLIGASPEIMDIDVTDKIEEAVNTINGVKSITSTSIEGYSGVLVFFNIERDIDLAIQDVREQISAIRSSLPEDVSEPVIQKVNPDTSPVIWITLSGRRTQLELSTYVDEVLKEQFQRIEGVGSLTLSGMQKRQIRIWLDADKLRAYGIASSDIAAYLRRENVELPGGRIEGPTKEYSIKVKGSLRNLDSFNNLIVAYYMGAPVRIRDIGRAEDGMQEKRSVARYNGIPCVGIGIQKQTGANTVEVVRRVKAELERIRKTLPAGMELNIAFDQSTFIIDSMNQVKEHLILGSILAVIAIFVFLRNFRTTLISAVALPVSIVSTFTVMWLFGFTFNNMTMLALALSVGILIDDAIIVIENIYRHIEEGMKPMEAASFATSEIGPAVVATTVAIVVIFLPAAFMKGLIGKFFIQFSLTVVFSVLVSLLVSFTLTPMLSSIFLRPGKEVLPSAKGNELFEKACDRLEKWYAKVEGYYRPILAYSLDHREKVLIGALVLFLLSLLLTVFIGKEFKPAEDQSQFVVRLEAPVDYSLDKARDLFTQAESIIKARPDIKGIFYTQGTGMGSMGEINKAVLFTRLVPKSERRKSQNDIMADLRKRLKVIPGLKTTIEEVSILGGGLRNLPIEYAISGGTMDELRKYAKAIAGELSKMPGIVDVDTSVEAGKPELSLYIDRDKATDLGVSTYSIAEAVNLLISGEVDLTKYKDEVKGRRYDVRIRLNPEDRARPEDISKLYVRAIDGKLVALDSVVSVEEGGGPSSIVRKDRQHALWIFANLEGKPLGTALGELNRISARILPPDYTTSYVGESEEMGKSFTYLTFAILLGVLLAYMVLAAQFESLIDPVTILLAMPISLIGAFGALFITGKSISVVSYIGLILLMGLVKKNSILLVDYTNTLRKRGMSRREAILHAGPVRLRPILMTTFAMVFGMLPVALGIGEGSDIRSPMGVTVIGGLLASLFLTLAVVPAAYDLFDDWKIGIRRFIGKRFSSGEPARTLEPEETEGKKKASAG